VRVVSKDCGWVILPKNPNGLLVKWCGNVLATEHGAATANWQSAEMPSNSNAKQATANSIGPFQTITMVKI
jgi:hypothetical protein